MQREIIDVNNKKIMDKSVKNMTMMKQNIAIMPKYNMFSANDGKMCNSCNKK
jgi:hypothetical protein